MNAHQENLEKIKKLTSELSECMRSVDYEEFPTPYTSCDDPEVDYARADWAGHTYDVKSIRYSKFPCKDLVDDLVVSSQLESFKQWDRNFRRKYYTRALFMAYEQGKQSNEGILAKIKRLIKSKVDSFAYWCACKFL